MFLGLNTKLPYHFLLYSISFGGASFYSFIVSPLVFRELPREEFSNLQNKVFPTYFKYQTLAPLALAALSPWKLCPFSLGLLGLSAAAGGLNWGYLLPKCKQLKEDRQKLEEDSGEFKRLTKQFGAYHGISMLVNVLSIASLGVYGLVVARRFR